MSIERRFDIPLVAAMALKEKQIQQNYRPIIAVHKWFARRPGTLFRALLLSEFEDHRLDEMYFAGHDFQSKVVADPFMGGGSPLVEANRIGCDVMGFDINPMATWIVREEIEHIDLDEYGSAAAKLVAHLASTVGEGYRTDCVHYGERDVPVKYFLWVKTLPCAGCGQGVDLFPGYLIADDTRHTKNVLVCAGCGELNEVASLGQTGRCRQCRKALRVEGPAHRGHCACPRCGHDNKYPHAGDGPLGHRLFAIEYFNPERKQGHKGRFFKKPDTKDLARCAAAR
jgi:adenine-specific DNA methylase